METKANTALIGAFTLIVFALAFVFIYWLARGGEQSSSVPLTVVFENPVTGLTVGGQVLFNGINVGTVKTLELDPDNPKVVLAGVRIQPLPSIKADTEVTLGFQGLTGLGYIEMAGGSPNLPPIWEAMPEPTLTASRSGMQDLMAGARTILGRVDETLGSVERLVSENSDDVAQAVKDVRAFTGALAANSDEVANLIDQVSTATSGIADAAGRLQGIAERSEALLAAIDPEQVRSTLADLSTTTANIAEQTSNFGPIVERAEAISADVQIFAQHLPALGEKADALAAAIDPATVSAALERLEAISAAIDPERVRTTVEGLSSLAETLQANRENIDMIVTRVTSLSSDLSEFATHLPAMGERTDALLAALDPAKLTQTVDNVNQFTTTLAENRDDIDAIVADARNVAARFNSLGDRAESLLTKLDAMAGEGSGGIMADAQATLAAIRAAADSFNTQITAVGGGLGDFSDRGLRDFQTMVSDGQRTISRLDRVISNLEQNPSGFIFGGETVPEYSGRRR